MASRQNSLSALLLLALFGCSDSGPAVPAVGAPPLALPPPPTVPALPPSLPPPAPLAPRPPLPSLTPSPIPSTPEAPRAFITCRTDADCPHLACGPCTPGAPIPGGPQPDCARNPCPGAIAVCEPGTGRCVVRRP